MSYCQVESGQVRFITRPKPRTIMMMRAKRKKRSRAHSLTRRMNSYELEGVQMSSVLQRLP